MSVTRIQILGKDGEYLIPQEQTPLAVTKTISEIKDLSKRRGSFSKTVTFAGDKRTNQILGHLYNVNLTDSSFDRKAITKVIIIQDGVEILEGNMRLLSVTKESRVGEIQHKITYEAVVYNEIGAFFQALDSLELTDLDFSAFNHTYLASNVSASILNTVDDGYKYTWPYIDGNEYLLSDFRPAIFAKQYWDKILANAGYTYTWDNLATDRIRFDKLLVPYNGDALKINPEDFETFYVRAINNTPQVFNAPSASIQLGQQLFWTGQIPVVPTDLDVTQFLPGTYPATYQVDANTEEIDNGNNYNPTTSVYTSPVVATGNQSFKTRVKCNITFKITNPAELVDATIYKVSGNSILAPTGSEQVGWNYKIRVQAINQNGVQIGSGTLNVGSAINSVANPYILQEEETVILADALDFDFNITSTNLQIGDTIRLIVVGTHEPIAPEGFAPRWVTTATTPPSFLPITQELTINSWQIEHYPDPETVQFGSTLRMNNVIPKKIKQSDFIKGILNLYNLYVDVEPGSPNNLIIKTRDDYYDSGETRDWTRLLVTDIPQELRFANEESGRIKLLKYKEGKSPLNEGYQSLTGETYGQFSYYLDDKNLRGTDTIELPFSPTQVLRTDFGAYTLAVNGYEPKSNIKLVYDGGFTPTQTNYWIIDYFAGPNNTNPVGEFIAKYNYTGHFDDPLEPNFDLNFGFPQFLPYDGTVVRTENNMYNLHWRRTFGQINDGKILEAYFWLTPEEFSAVRLNDRIFVHDTYYNIVEIQDYNANSKQPTKVKLITVDDNVSLGRPSLPPIVIDNGTNNPSNPTAPGGQLPNIPAPPPPPSNPGLPNLQEDIRRIKNINLGGPSNTIQGYYNYLGPDAKNNYVTGNSNFINGSSNTIIGDRFFVERDKTIQNESRLVNGTEDSFSDIQNNTMIASEEVNIKSTESFIAASKTSEIDEGTGNSIISSQDSNVVDSNNSNIIGSRLSDIINQNNGSSIFGGVGNTITGPVGSASNNNSIFGSVTCIIDGDGPIQSNSILSSNLSNINGGIQTILNIITGGGSHELGDSTGSNLIGNSIIGGVLNEILNPGQSALYNTILGGNNNVIQTDGASINNSVILGGNNNTISGANNAVILGGTGITATDDNTVYVPNFDVSGKIVADRLELDGESGTTAGPVIQVVSLNETNPTAPIAIFTLTTSNTGIGGASLGFQQGLNFTGIQITEDGTTIQGPLNIGQSYTPTGTADTTGVEGQITYDDDYIYVKTSAGWKRSALSTF